MFKKISIVTTNLNGGKYLEETILSVIDQNYPNLEYIIIDGGSNDSSIDIIKKYEDKLVYWESRPDEGNYHAIQKGFEKSTGEIMGWINSDDKLIPKSLFILNEVFHLSNVEWIHGAPTIIDREGRYVIAGGIIKWSLLDYINGKYKWIQQESCYWSRNLWEISGAKLNLEYKYAGDLELWSRFFQFGHLYSLAAPIGSFRHSNENQISRKYVDLYNIEANDIVLKLKDKMGHRSKKIKTLFQFLTILSLFKIFNNSAVERFIRKKFNYKSIIYYNLANGKFEFDTENNIAHTYPN